MLVTALLMAALFAQPSPAGEIHRMGVLLYDGAPPGLLEAFREGLHELGYIEGETITLEFRDAAGNLERLGALAEELVQLDVDVILAVNTPAAQAAKQATATIPIVITRVADPVKSGLVPSLAHPGGNLTGLSVMHTELSAKRIELLREIIPDLSRVVVLSNADNPGHAPQVEEIELASSQLDVEVLNLPVKGASDLPRAFQALTGARADALIVLDDTAFTNHRDEILDLAAERGLPVVSRYKDFADAGALIAYGPSLPALYRRAVYYTDRILKGARPSDLPIEQPTRFDLIVNLQAARSLGLTVPPAVLMRADHVIE